MVICLMSVYFIFQVSLQSTWIYDDEHYCKLYKFAAKHSVFTLLPVFFVYINFSRGFI